MAEYVVRRLVYGLLVLFMIVIFIFVVMRAIPGDVIELQFADAVGASEEQVSSMRAELGLDQNIFAQFTEWIQGVFQGDLGTSLWTNQPVIDMIAARLPVTLQLVIMSTIMSIFIGIPLGIISAVKHNTVIDNFIRVISVGGLSIPNFWFGMLILTFLALYFNWIPPLSFQSFTENPVDNLQQMFFPALCIALTSSAGITRMTRSASLEVLQSDFIRTVRSKGAKERLVLFKHMLRNSLIPIITLIGIQVGYELSGTVIIETIFGLPGMGSMIFESVNTRDYPVVQAAVLVYAALFVLVNLIVDLVYGGIDPRIRNY